MITGLIHNKPEDNTDQWMNIEQLRAYYPDRPARSTIYDWVCQNSIPVHKDGKKLRFLKSEIDQWLGLGLQKTQEEIKQEAYDLTSNDDFTTWYRMNAEEHGSPLLGIEPKHKTTETNKSTVMITLNTLNPPQFSFFTHSTQGYP